MSVYSQNVLYARLKAKATSVFMNIYLSSRSHCPAIMSHVSLMYCWKSLA